MSSEKAGSPLETQVAKNDSTNGFCARFRLSAGSMLLGVSLRQSPEQRSEDLHLLQPGLVSRPESDLSQRRTVVFARHLKVTCSPKHRPLRPVIDPHDVAKITAEAGFESLDPIAQGSASAESGFKRL